jgi:hypothetical protein
MLAVQGDESAVRGTYDEGKKVVSDIEQHGIAPAGGKVKAGDYIYHQGQVMKIGDDGKTAVPVMQ